MEVRPAAASDLEQINDIYNHYIRNHHYTFDIEAWPMESRREWFSHYSTTGRYRLLVAAEGDVVRGYASSGRFRPKSGYNTSVETSVYLSKDRTAVGLGTALYRELFGVLAGEDVHRAYAGITMPNPQSVALHEQFGFKQVAYFTEQGRKFDRYWDVAWFEKALNG